MASKILAIHVKSTDDSREDGFSHVCIPNVIAHVYNGSLGVTDGAKVEIGEVWTVVEANAYSLGAEVYVHDEDEAFYGATRDSMIFRKSDAEISEDLHALQAFIDALGLPVAHVVLVETRESLGHTQEDQQGFLNLLAGMIERSLKVQLEPFDWTRLALDQKLTVMESEEKRNRATSHARAGAVEIQAQKSRTQTANQTRKSVNARKGTYPNAAAVVAALDARTADGKKNYASVLVREEPSLYLAALKFRRAVKLPRKPNTWVTTFEKSKGVGPASDPRLRNAT